MLLMRDKFRPCPRRFKEPVRLQKVRICFFQYLQVGRLGIFTGFMLRRAFFPVIQLGQNTGNPLRKYGAVCSVVRRDDVLEKRFRCRCIIGCDVMRKKQTDKLGRRAFMFRLSDAALCLKGVPCDKQFGWYRCKTG